MSLRAVEVEAADGRMAKASTRVMDEVMGMHGRIITVRTMMGRNMMMARSMNDEGGGSASRRSGFHYAVD